MNSIPYGAIWLNDTIAFAGCYAAARSASKMTSIITTPTAVTGLKTTTTGPTATSTTTKQLNGVAARAENIEMWMVAGTGVAAAVVNSVL